MNESAEPAPPDAPQRRPRRRVRRWVWRIATTASLLCVLSFALLSWTPVGVWIARPLVVSDPLEKADAIVVLGGRMDRVVAAAALYHDGWAPLVVVSSVGEDAERMGRILRHAGVPAEAIRIDRNPFRTQDHPRTIAQFPEITKNSRLLVVTSQFHTARSRACFDKAGYKHVRLRYPPWQVSPGSEKSYIGAGGGFYVTYELLAWSMYRLRGWL